MTKDRLIERMKFNRDTNAKCQQLFLDGHFTYKEVMLIKAALKQLLWQDASFTYRQGCSQQEIVELCQEFGLTRMAESFQQWVSDKRPARSAPPAAPV